MSILDWFKKKPSAGVSPGQTASAVMGQHKHFRHASHAQHIQPCAPGKATGKLRRYLTDRVPTKPDEDSTIPTMASGFLVGELLGSLTAPSSEPASSGPTDDTNTTPEFSGFGGGTSGGGGASGSWDAPTDGVSLSTDVSSAPDVSSASGDSGGYDGSSASGDSGSFDSGSSGGVPGF